MIISNNKSMIDIKIPASIISLVFGILAFFLGTRKSSESGIINTYVPVDSIHSLPDDTPVVVSGTIQCDQPLTSPVTKKPCVYYRYILEKRTEINDKGNITYEWKNVGSPQEARIPFALKDATGIVEVKPDGAEINQENQFQTF